MRSNIKISIASIIGKIRTILPIDKDGIIISPAIIAIIGIAMIGIGAIIIGAIGIDLV